MSDLPKKKWIMTLLCLLGLLLLGAKKAPIRLELDANTHLIDLDKVIERAEWGSSGEDGEGEDPSEGPSAEDGTDPGAGGSPVVKPYEIRIEGKQISVNGGKLSQNQLPDYLKHDDKSMKEKGVILIDAFADSKIYKEVRRLLDDSGIGYSEQQE